jgi:cytidylate kinase
LASLFERWQIDTRKLSRYTSEEILRLAQQGNVLIRGWGAAALFRDVPQVISVRVCAPMAFREHVMMERLSVRDADAVRQEIERFDAAHAETMGASFNVDREDTPLPHGSEHRSYAGRRLREGHLPTGAGPSIPR